MIRRPNPALPCAGTGPVSAAKSPKPSLQKTCGGKMRDQLARSGWQKRYTCIARRHSDGRYAQ